MNEFDGLGIVYLPKSNITTYGHILTQEDFTVENTVYSVRYNYDLKGATVTIPAGCTLKFDGGSITNGTIKGSGTIIDAGRVKIFGLNVVTDVSGSSWNISEAYPEWFGAVMNDESVDNSVFINKTLDAFRTANTRRGINGDYPRVPCVLANGSYYVANSVIVQGRFRSLLGNATRNTYIIMNNDEGEEPIVQLGYINKTNPSDRNPASGCHVENLNIVGSPDFDNDRGVTSLRTGLQVGTSPLGQTSEEVSDSNGASCTRGVVRNIRIYRCNIGLYLDYQWCNTLDTFIVSRCNKGIVTGWTSPYVSNCQIETNYQAGVESLENSSGIKLSTSVIEGNKYGAILNGGECSFVNCYFEANDESATNANAEKEIINYESATTKYYRTKFGGHILCGKDAIVKSLTMVDCHFANGDSKNNQIYVDKCNQLIISGDSYGIIPLKTTKNCVISSLPNSLRLSNQSEISIRNWLYNQNAGVKSVNPVYECNDFRNFEQVYSGTRATMVRAISGKSDYIRITGNAANINISDSGYLYPFRTENESNAERQIVAMLYIDPLCSRDKDLYIAMDYQLNKKEVMMVMNTKCLKAWPSGVAHIDPLQDEIAGKKYAIIPSVYKNGSWASTGGSTATIQAGYPSSYHVIIPKEALQHKQTVVIDGIEQEVYTYDYIQLTLRLTNESFVSAEDDKLEENLLKVTRLAIYEGNQISSEFYNNVSVPARDYNIRSIARDGFVVPYKRDNIITEQGLTCIDALGNNNYKMVFSPTGNSSSTQPLFVDSQGYTPVINKGTTEQRPTGLKSNYDIGLQYFDTTLGKPIFVKSVAGNGTPTWVDATGTVV